jgi:hypothetical protein
MADVSAAEPAPPEGGSPAIRSTPARPVLIRPALIGVVLISIVLIVSGALVFVIADGPSTSRPGVFAPASTSSSSGSSDGPSPDGGSAAGLAPFGEAAPASPSPTADPIDAQIESVLNERSVAVAQRQADAFLQTDSTTDVAFLARQQMLAENLTTLPFTQWQYRLGDRRFTTDAVAGPLLMRFGTAARAYAVDVDYRLGDVDPQGTRGRRLMVFVPEGTTWKVAADVDTGVFREPWDVTPLRAVAGRSVLLLVSGDSVRSDDVLRQAERAVAAVTAIWGTDWARRVVVIAPRSQTQLGTMLRRPGRDYTTLAAVATAERGSDVTAPPVNRVWINPSGFGRITELGRLIVLRHEITHVATGAALPSNFAIWLEEGFADYVGYLQSGVSQDIIASELLADARAGSVPNTLPGKPDFRSTNPQLSQAYEGAWWAARLIAQRYGRATLIDVYRTALAQPDPRTAVDVALRKVLGLTTAQFTNQWRSSIKAAA